MLCFNRIHPLNKEVPHTLPLCRSSWKWSTHTHTHTPSLPPTFLLIKTVVCSCVLQSKHCTWTRRADRKCRASRFHREWGWSADRSSDDPDGGNHGGLTVVEQTEPDSWKWSCLDPLSVGCWVTEESLMHSAFGSSIVTDWLTDGLLTQIDPKITNSVSPNVHYTPVRLIDVPPADSARLGAPCKRDQVGQNTTSDNRGQFDHREYYGE